VLWLPDWGAAGSDSNADIIATSTGIYIVEGSLNNSSGLSLPQYPMEVHAKPLQEPPLTKAPKSGPGS